MDALSLAYFPVAVGLGALHALEPGHSKTLIAAYLIGTKGTKRDAFLLGLSAATTHSLVVIALAVTALYLGQEAFTGRATYWLQVGSGVIVVALGLWMLWRRWPRQHAHHHAPATVLIPSGMAPGEVSIIDTPGGERLTYTCAGTADNLRVSVHIDREAGAIEVVELHPNPEQPGRFISTTAPAEPHEFTANLILHGNETSERHPFAMHEPEGHDHLDDDAHARAHAAAMPSYVAGGGRPSPGQVIAFGAAGGLIPCPASITVMLLALSIGKAALGMLAVLCFSLGLAVALVGMGMLVVAGAAKLGAHPRFALISSRAPFLSAALVIATGLVALAFAH